MDSKNGFIGFHVCLQGWVVVRSAVYHFLPVGFLIYLASVFFLDGGHQKTFFYFMVALPGLLLLWRVVTLFRVSPWPLISLFFLLFYYALSALWSGGEGAVTEALKYSLYIILLMLGVEAAASRYSSDFIVRFIVFSGGGAVLSYCLAIIFGEASLSQLLVGRFSMHEVAGWGADNPITSAVTLGVPVIAAWWLFPGRGWRTQLMLVLLMVMSFLLIFITKSRGPLLALMVVLFMIALFRRSRCDFMLLVGGGGGLVVLSWMLNLDSVVAERVAAPNYRLEIWQQALNRFLENWIWGQGYGSDARITVGGDSVVNVVTHSHSSLFEMFRVGGVVGGGLFIATLLLFVVPSVARRPSFFFMLWLIYGAICLSTNGRLLLVRPSVEWFAFWFPLFLLYYSVRSGSDSDCVS